MNDLWLQHLDLIAAAPDGVKRLRELILELAVRGKLVPQNPDDEPARELLKRIQAEKARLVTEGKIKKDKPLPVIGEEEKPFDLPVGWEWVRLGNLVNIVYGKGLSTQELTPDGFEVFGANGVIGRYPSYMYETRQLLLSCRGAYSGKPNISPERCFVTSNSLVLESQWLLLNQMFLFYALQSSDNGQLVTGSAQPQVTTTNAVQLPISLPPLAEQYRIVAKVDELMALCDQLEARQSEGGKAHATLVKILLDTLTAPSQASGGVGAARPDRFPKPVRSDSGAPSAPERMDDDFTGHWERIARHFDTLFTSEASIDALKQTILQLAVMGKLVPQNPDDEPASELLKRIQAEKARLVAEGKIKKDKPLPAIGEEEKPFELPAGWEWVRMGILLPEFQNGVSSRGDAEGEQVTVLRLADIKEGNISLADTRSLTIATSVISKYQLTKGDILIVRVNGSAEIVGRFVSVGEISETIYCDHFIRLRIAQDFIEPQFLTLIAASKLVRDKISRLFITTAGQKTVNQEHIRSLVIPLMSVAQQHRIVAKVDELMALCDQLADRLKAARERSGQYATATTRSALKAA